MDDSYLLEKPFRWMRLKKIADHINEGSLLDFGCGEKQYFRKFVKRGRYHGIEKNRKVRGAYDNIVLAAVLEHLDSPLRVLRMLKSHMSEKGRMIITTPTRKSRWLLGLLAWAGLLDPENIRGHKHYWDRAELIGMSKSMGLRVKMYARFQLGFNQLIVLGKNGK